MGDINRCVVLSAVTSTLVLRRSTIEGAAEPTPEPKSQNHTFDKARIVMNSLFGQRLWKGKLVAGLLTIVLGAIVLL